MAAPDIPAEPHRVRRFLTELYGTADGGHIALWSLAPDRSSGTAWFPVSALDLAAVHAAARSDAGDQVYFGVGLHPEPLGPNRRGTEAGVSALPGLYVDIDFGQEGHTAADLPPTLDDALALLTAIPTDPTVVIHSGHGLQAYWLFREVFTIETPEERTFLRLLNRRLQRALRAAAAEHGWSLDATADLARVLRPPGTVNRKSGCDPVLVRGLRTGGPRPTTDDLDEVLPPLPSDRQRSHSEDAGDRVDADRPDPAAIYSACAYLRHVRDDAATLTEPEWHAGLSILALCHGGEDLAHAISRPYPRYDWAETQRKFERARAEDKPMTCATIRSDRGGEAWCRHCPLPRWITSPVELGYLRAGPVVVAGERPSTTVPSRAIPLRRRGGKEGSRRGFRPIDLVNGRAVPR